MTTKLAGLMRAVHTAEEAVLAELKVLYPDGTRLLARLQSNHVHASTVTVITQYGGRWGQLRVRCESGHMTTIAHSQVVGPA